MAESRARRGSGSIYKRRPSDKFWVIKYPGGKPETTSFTEKELAQKLLNKRLAAVSDQPGYAGARDYRLSALEKLVLSDYEARGKASSYKITTAFKKLRDFLGNARATEITTRMLRAYITHRRGQDAARSTIRNELMALSKAFSLLRKEEDLSFAPPAIPSISVGNTARKGFFERAAFECVRGLLPEERKDVVLFAYFSGWRISEVVGLEWANNVDVKREVVALLPEQQKTTTDEPAPVRVFPYSLFPEFKELIERRRELTDEAERDYAMKIPWVFWKAPSHDTQKRRKRMGLKAVSPQPLTRWFHKSWRKACETCNVGAGLIHDFRRTAVRNLIVAGVDRKTAMEITGHKTEAVFNRYHIVPISDKEQALQRLGTFLEAERQKAENVVPLDTRRRARGGKQGS